MSQQPRKHGLDSGTDEVLLRLIQSGSEAALSELYDLRSQLVYSLALSVVRSPEDAEEITQEVFLRIWDKAATFDTARGSALAWITTITRRLAIDKTRSKHHRARGRQVSIDATAETGAATLEPVAENATTGVAAREVLDAMARLTDQHREVIELSYFQGLSHALIADRLDAPLGTIKSRIREAVRQLRKQLGLE